MIDVIRRGGCFLSFFQIGWLEHSELYSSLRPPSEWDSLFSQSAAVHAYASGPGSKGRIRPRRFYGAEIPAYLHLAEENCPRSLHSEKTF